MFLRDPGAAEVGTRLGLGDDFSHWLLELESMGPSMTPVHLPDTHEVGDLFARLCLQPSDAAEILDVWPQPSQTPEVWWLLQRCHQQLVAQIGDPSSPPRRQWLPLPPHLGSLGRFFYVYVYLAALPTIRQWHRERSIPDDVSWATLADLGEHLAIHRRMFGEASLDIPDWLTLHFRGLLYRLGRLQFHRWRFPLHVPIDTDTIGNDVTELRPSPGALALDVHIPESGGPLSPAACSESFAQARDFFARYFPEEKYRFAWCASWLLDPQLANYLPPTSNIVCFQRRFHLVAGGSNSDQGIMRFVFRRVAPSLDELPQRTALERAVVSHLRAGQHWQVRSGWLVL